MNSCRSQTIFVQSFCFTASYREISTILPVFSEPQGSPGAAFRCHVVKYGEKLLDKKKDSGEQAACEYPLELVHLKKFVQVSEGTGFCVDTENAAV